jgi:hypothetical protein
MLLHCNKFRGEFASVSYSFLQALVGTFGFILYKYRMGPKFSLYIKLACIFIILFT